MRSLLISLLIIGVIYCDESIVQTKFGAVQGFVGEQYRSFAGIPFVAPPVNELRWTFPLPPPAPWSPNTLQAINWRAGCPQKCLLPPHTCPDTMSEDCLYLNIFTPRLANLTQPQPVMVFLPGGHFEQGTAGCTLYNASSMAAASNLVIVTVNYRLGFLGWLTTEDLIGNFGFSDQIQALQWIKDNIAPFGGDPTQVTLFGQSAGATSLRAHLTSPSSKGLFHKVISQSDPFTLPMRDASDAINFGLLFLQ